MDINSHLSLSHVTSRFTSWLFLSISSSWSLSSSGSLYAIKVFVLSSTVWQWNTEVNCKTWLRHTLERWEVKGRHHKLFRCASFHVKLKTFLRFSLSFTWQRRAGSPKTTKFSKTCSRVNLLKPSFRLWKRQSGEPENTVTSWPLCSCALRSHAEDKRAANHNGV